MFSVPDMAVVLAIVLIIFGPGKLPDIGSSLGKGIRNFKKATEDEESAEAKPEQLSRAPAESVAELEHKPVAAEDTTPNA